MIHDTIVKSFEWHVFKFVFSNLERHYYYYYYCNFIRKDIIGALKIAHIIYNIHLTLSNHLQDFEYFATQIPPSTFSLGQRSKT